MCKYDEDYYKNGIKTKKSGYENFHYIPTRSFPEAIDIVNNFNFNSIIDYGCCFGYLVHCFRQLGKDAYGEDISDYAIEHAYYDVKDYVGKPFDRQVDFLLGKDILEHVLENEIDETLKFLYNKANEFLFVIPLGDDDLFRIREYELDLTHVTKKSEDWWINKFKENGFKVKWFDYKLGRVKEKWTSIYPYGNGFFNLEKV